MNSTQRTCPITHEPIYDGTVSRTAIERLRVATQDLPELMSHVAYALTGLKHGNTDGPAGIPTSKPPINLGMLDDIDDMRDSINTWASEILRFLQPSAKYRNGAWNVLPVLLEKPENRDRLRNWTEAVEMVEELLYVVRRLEHLASPSRRTMIYAGPCPGCGLDLLARPDQDTTECRDCGQTITVQNARDNLHTRLGMMELPISQAITATHTLTGVTLRPSTVRSWVKRGHLEPRKTAGQSLYPVRVMVDLSTKRGHG